jgi:phage terminase large subunit-like protein
MLDLHYKFISDVINPENDLRYGDAIKKLVQRYLDDELRDDIYFDEDEAQRHLDYISIMPLVDAEWSGKLMQEMMQPWQAFFFANIYGWKYTATHIRKHTDVYLQIPKKNAKTTMAAMIANDNAVNDSVPGAQIYFAGYTIDTADLCFKFTKRMCEKMVAMYPSMEGHIKPWAHSVEFVKTETFLKKVSSDAKTLEGKGARCAIIDEVHTHPNGMVIENMRSGMALYNDPLLVQITTPGYDKQEPCPAYPKYEHCKKVLAGIVKDDRLMPMLWEPDEADDWNDESTWAKANPNIGISPKWDFLRGEYNLAKINGGSKEVSFKIKHLGMWVDSDVVWISDDVWMANQRQIHEPLPEIAYGGLDLASVTDFCWLTFCHPTKKMVDGYEIDQDGEMVPVTKEVTERRMVYMCYLPEETVKTHKMESVRTWAREGYIKTTTGRTTDYRVIKQDIINYCRDYTVPIIYYDRYNANQLIDDLVDEGINMQPFAQTPAYMNVPTREMQKTVVEGYLQHSNHPVMRWMMRNVRIIEDNNGNQKISKNKSRDAVDGPVATVMAIGAELDGGRPTDMPGVWVFDV